MLNCRGVEDAAPYDETHRFLPIKAFCYSPYLLRFGLFVSPKR